MTNEQVTVFGKEEQFELALDQMNLVMTKEAGYSPTQLLASAVGGCEGYVLKSLLLNSKVPAEVTKIKVDYQRADTRPQFFQSIDLTFEIVADPKWHHRIESIMKLVEKYCPVVQSLSPDIEITETIIFL